VDSGIKIEGEFELPPLVRLSGEDQVLSWRLSTSMALSKRWRVFGISYPTVKNRLNQIARQFEYGYGRNLPGRKPWDSWTGEISAEEAIKRLSK
jgi:hypothetical protein